MLNKNLIILTICQVFSFTAPPITVFISGIVGLKISPIASLATLPTSLSIVGTAVFSFFAAKIMSKIGRKKGFILSSTYSSLASLLGAYSIYTENFILFCFSCFVIGTGIAFTHQYRFAAAETVEKNDSSRAISILLLATILSALIGPNVANFSKNIISDHLYTGSYISLAILTFLPVFLLIFYRTDNNPKSIENIDSNQRSYFELLKNPIILQAIVSAAFAYSVMSFIMTATPISMYKMHGFTLGSTSIVIQSHIIGMFLPSLITGILIKKFGHSVIIYTGALIYLVCIYLSFYDQTFVNYLIALVLLGIGWNFLFIGGTSLLVLCYKESEKFKVQGFNDVLVFSIQSIASLIAGYSILKFSWNEINLACIPLVLLIILVSIRADIYKKKLIAFYSSIPASSSSLIILTPSFSAFSFLAGPMLSPATMKSVDLEIELTFLPPLSSMSFFSSFLLKRIKTPLTTILAPSKELLASSFSTTSNCKPAAFSCSISSLFSAMLK